MRELTPPSWPLTTDWAWSLECVCVGRERERECIISLLLFWFIPYFSSVQNTQTPSKNGFKTQKKTELCTAQAAECESGTHQDSWEQQKRNMLTHLGELKSRAHNKAI